jgi:LysM repeat protein
MILKRSFQFTLSAALLLLVLPFIVFAQPKDEKKKTRYSRAEYINMYAGFAVKEMLISGVPASITLAQGILESGDGNSSLAKKAKNHFGIKCHGMWEGKKHYMDDDAKDECFRVYNSVFESYKDHSNFLKGRGRYEDLFKLRMTDYKGWARGLKKAGYATNPKYPALLIRIIEENDLAKYDKMKKAPKGGAKLPKEQKEKGKNPAISVIQDDTPIVSAFNRQMYQRNGIKFIRVKDEDTFESLERLLGMRKWQFYKYNVLSCSDQLEEGMVLFMQAIMNKTRKADYHIAARNESLRWVSQEYGVKLSKIAKYNGITTNTETESGQKIWLRKPRKK